MKKTKFIIFISLIILIIGSAFTRVLSDNGIAGRTGSPGETTCSSCHGTSGSGSVSIDLPIELQGGASYTLNQTYTISVTVNQNSCNLFGIGFEALLPSGLNGGNLTAGTGTTTKNAVISGKTRKNIVHTLNGGASANSHTFTFTWTSPATNGGDVTFYVASLAANGDGTANASDKTYLKNITIPAPSTIGLVDQKTLDYNYDVFPNPVQDKFNINYFLSTGGIVKTELKDLSGKSIYVVEENRNPGNYSSTLDRNELHLKSGIYFVQVSINNNFIQTKKLLVF